MSSLAIKGGAVVSSHEMACQVILKALEKADQSKLAPLLDRLPTSRSAQAGEPLSLESKIISYIRSATEKNLIKPIREDIELIERIARKHIKTQDKIDELNQVMQAFTRPRAAAAAVALADVAVPAVAEAAVPPPVAVAAALAPALVPAVAAAAPAVVVAVAPAAPALFPVAAAAAAAAAAPAAAVAPAAIVHAVAAPLVLDAAALAQIRVRIDSLPEGKRARLEDFRRAHLVGASESRVLSILDAIISVPEECFGEILSLLGTINTAPRLKIINIEKVLNALSKYNIPELYSLKIGILQTLFSRHWTHKFAIIALEKWESLTEAQQNKASMSMQLLFEQDELWDKLFTMAYPEPSLEVWNQYVDDLTAVVFAHNTSRFSFWVMMFESTSPDARAIILHDIELNRK